MAESHRKVRRAPVLIPGRYAGIEIPRGRAIRIELATDGSLVVHDDAGTRTVAGPHEVTKAVVLTKAQAPRWADKSEPRSRAEKLDGALQLFALMAGPRPVLIVSLNEFAPQTPAGTTEGGAQAVRLREQSGASSLCHALGVLIEAPTPEDIAAITSPQARSAAVELVDPSARSPRFAPVIAGIGIAVAFAAWPQGFSVLTASISVVAAVVIAPLVWRTFRGRRLFLKVADSELTLPDGTRFVATAPPTRGLRDAWLVLSRERFVFHARGAEFTAAGPALGGVVSCEVWDDIVAFLDADRDTLLSLQRPCFFTSDHDLEQLGKVCRDLGLAYGRFNAPVASFMHGQAAEGAEGISIARARDLTGFVRFSWQAGGPGSATPVLTWIATMMQFGTGFGLFAVQEQLWAIPLFVVYTAMFVMATYSSVALSRWSTRQRRKVRHVLTRG